MLQGCLVFHVVFSYFFQDISWFDCYRKLERSSLAHGLMRHSSDSLQLIYKWELQNHSQSRQVHPSSLALMPWNKGNPTHASGMTWRYHSGTIQIKLCPCRHYSVNSYKASLFSTLSQWLFLSSLGLSKSMALPGNLDPGFLLSRVGHLLILPWIVFWTLGRGWGGDHLCLSASLSLFFIS